jgi:pretoxin HINT domain-containing protein
VPGTKVLLADGKTKSIEDVKVGDKVVATDPKTGKTRLEPVIAAFSGIAYTNLVQITVDTDGKRGHRTGVITATEHHKFWDPTHRQWTRADRLIRGATLRTPAGTRVKVVRVSFGPGHPVVLDLTVADVHTYYVEADGTPVLVHNCGDANPYFSAYPRDFLDQAAKYGKGGVRELPDGRFRFYGEISKARTPGEMVGRRLAREWNPETGATRIWHETLDYAGNVRIVRPDVAVTGGNKVHYMFDVDGNYMGKW